MKQNDLVALGLSALVVGGLAVFGRQLGGGQPASVEPNPRPNPPPGVNPLPFPPPAPGSDPQYDAARRAIDTLVAALQAQGGGTPAQREQVAQALDTQAATIEASGQSPAAATLLRQASQQLRSGQLPVVPPSPNPAPAPFPIPPFPNPFLVQTAPPAGGATSAPPAGGATQPSADLVRARAAIQSADREMEEIRSSPTPLPPFPFAQDIARRLFATRVNYQDSAAVEAIRVAAQRIGGPAAGIPATGQAVTNTSTPSTPSPDLMARYAELRDHCADFLQGARAIDPAALGAADRTSTDLLRAGDTNRAADLGALATASYARAGIVRPVPVTA